MTRIYSLVLLTAILIVALTVAAPWLASVGHPAFSMVIYQTFAPLCHQLPERSFALSGFPLAVCARCSGLYAGFAAGMLALSVASVAPRSAKTLLRVLAVSFLPLIVDGFGGWFGIFENTHFTRFLTGSIAGAGVAYFVAAVIAQSALLKERTVEDNPL